jgi:hypothetical protein
MSSKLKVFKISQDQCPGKNPLGSGIVGGGANTGSGAGVGAEVFESCCPNEAKYSSYILPTVPEPNVSAITGSIHIHCSHSATINPILILWCLLKR